MKKKNFAKMAGLAIAGLAVASSNGALAGHKMEKCYGVVKAGKNDCGSAQQGGHSCAGAANIDGDKAEWIFVPKGIGERLVNGSTKPTV